MNSKQKPPKNSGLVQVPTMKLDGFCKSILFFSDPVKDVLVSQKWIRYLDTLPKSEAAAKRRLTFRVVMEGHL